MRRKIAIGVSVLTFGTLYIGLNQVADFIGVPTYIDFGETITVTHYYFDEDIDGETTDVGIYILVVSGLLAWRAYHWVLSGAIDGSLRMEQRRIWSYWLLGSTAFIVLSTPVWRLEFLGFLQWLVVLAIAAGVFWYFWQRYQRELYRNTDQCNSFQPHYSSAFEQRDMGRHRYSGSNFHFRDKKAHPKS